MPRNFSITEPHPTVPKSGGYIYGGRGGAGNFQRFKSDDVTSGPNASGPASRISLTRPFKRTANSFGRGGAGNMTSTSNDDSIFQFDEEMIKSRRETEAAPVYRVGRGGAGNLFTEPLPKPASVRKDSTDSSASESERITAARRNSGSVLSIFSRRSS